MNRRNFIRTSGLAGIMSTPLYKYVQQTTDNHQESITLSFNSIIQPHELQNLVNDKISFTVFSDGSAVIEDKINKQNWLFGPVAYQEEKSIEEELVWVRTGRSPAEQYPGRFSGKMLEKGIEWTLLGRERQPIGKFLTNYKLDNNQIVISIEQIDNQIPVLCFPTPVFSECLILPQGSGKLVRKPVSGRIFNPFWSGFNMRWFGGLRGENGWICILEDGFEDSGVMVSELAAFPVWQKSLGTWNYKRTVRYGFSNNGYVGLSKVFRQYALKKGFFKSLKEKASENPRVNQIIGSRILSFNTAYPPENKENFESKLQEIFADKTISQKVRIKIPFRDIPLILEDVRNLGVDRALVNIRGWMNGGYDYSHPDIWPPEKECGGEEYLKKAIDNRGNFLVSLHDNYQDIYPHCPSFPNGIIKRSNGTLMPGGFWAPGQCYIINGKDGLKNARRNWENIKTLGITGILLDTVGATQSYENYEQGNMLSRKDHLRYKFETLKFFRDKKLMTSTESGSDYFIPVVDHIENWHDRIPGETIPLWSLVFHDAVVNGKYRFNVIESLWGRDIDPSREEAYLEEMLWGYTTIFAMPSFEKWPLAKVSFRKSQVVDDWFEKICDSEMLNHKYLSEDFQLEQTYFSNGYSIIVNFSAEKKKYDNQIIEPGNYHINTE